MGSELFVCTLGNELREALWPQEERPSQQLSTWTWHGTGSGMPLLQLSLSVKSTGLAEVGLSRESLTSGMERGVINPILPSFSWAFQRMACRAQRQVPK